jgi:hypothetical protein
MSTLPKLQNPVTILDNRIMLETAFPTISTRPGAAYNTNYLTLRRDIVRKNDAVREYLRKHLHRRLAWSPDERNANRVGYNLGLPPLMYSEFLDRLARFIVAVGCGCSLIVPMLVMSFSPSQTKTLVTVSVAVVLFALVISLAFHTDNNDTLSATATYAAVLVVFVGINGGGILKLLRFFTSFHLRSRSGVPLPAITFVEVGIIANPPYVEHPKTFISPAASISTASTPG